MKILPLPDSIINLQKCYLSMKYFLEFGKYFNKYAVLQSENSGCIVQLYFKKEAHNMYCYTDTTVSLWQDGTTDLCYKTLGPSQIIPLEGPFEAKSVHVSIVFENTENLIEWKKSKHSHSVLYNLLKIFIIYHNCHIRLQVVNEYLNLGIHFITVNNIELRGKGKSQDLKKAAAKIVSSTIVIIDSESTKSMLSSNKASSVGGLEKPYNLLREIVAQNEVLKGTGMNVNKNILLIGPSGCGKKTLVRKVANDCGAFLIEINGTDILSPENSLGRSGEIEDNIKKHFDLIKTLCELLIIEENTSKNSTTAKKRNDSVNEQCFIRRSSVVFLLLINLDSLCPNRQRFLGKRMLSRTTQVLHSIDNLHELENLLIFATTSKVDGVDPAIRRPGRLDKEVFIGIPNEEERTLILEKIIPNYVDKETHSSSCLKVIAKKAAALTPGRVAGDLCFLCQEVRKIQLIRKLHRDMNSVSFSETWLEDFAHYAAKLPVSTLLHGPGTLINYDSQGSPQDQRPSLSSIGGLSSVKKRLQFSVKEPLIHPEGFKRLGIKPPKGILLFGPPGCAKTTLARALAMSSSNKDGVEPVITFLSCSAAELYSPYVGDSEKKVIELFQRARSGAPSIVFIDELDSLFGTREVMEKGLVQERVLSAILTEMDGVGHRLIAPAAASLSDGDQMLIRAEKSVSSQEKRNMEENACNDFSSSVMVIAATNRPDLIDEALLRPGRLDQLIFIPPPEEDGRYEILSCYTAEMPVCGNKESILKNLAKKTELFSGADLKNLCREAALHAITVEGFDVKEVCEEHFLTVLKSVRPSLTINQISSYEKFSKKILQ